MYNDIKRDFTIITNLETVIYVDSNIDVLEHIKIKSDNRCDISYMNEPKIHGKIEPTSELKNLNITANSLYIDLPLVKLTNVNIQVKKEFDFIVHNMETFKSVSGNISADKLYLVIKKSPLTKSLYLKWLFEDDRVYERVYNSKFIQLLEPDKFNVNTYCINNIDYFSFYITKQYNEHLNRKPLKGEWGFLYRIK